MEDWQIIDMLKQAQASSIDSQIQALPEKFAPIFFWIVRNDLAIENYSSFYKLDHSQTMSLLNNMLVFLQSCPDVQCKNYVSTENPVIESENEIKIRNKILAEFNWSQRLDEISNEIERLRLEIAAWNSRIFNEAQAISKFMNMECHPVILQSELLDDELRVLSNCLPPEVYPGLSERATQMIEMARIPVVQSHTFLKSLEKQLDLINEKNKQHRFQIQLAGWRQFIGGTLSDLDNPSPDATKDEILKQGAILQKLQQIAAELNQVIAKLPAEDLLQTEASRALERQTQFYHSLILKHLQLSINSLTPEEDIRSRITQFEALSRIRPEKMQHYAELIDYCKRTLSAKLST